MASPSCWSSAMVPSCGEHTISFLNDAIGGWAEQSHWPIGTTVTIQWRSVQNIAPNCPENPDAPQLAPNTTVGRCQPGP